MKKQEHQLKERVLGRALIYSKANFHLILRHPNATIFKQEDIQRIYVGFFTKQVMEGFWESERQFTIDRAVRTKIE